MKVAPVADRRSGDARARRRAWIVAAAIVSACCVRVSHPAASAASAASREAVPGAWQPVDLPDGMQARTLVAAGGELWIGGQQGAGDAARPAMVHGHPGRWTAVAVDAGTTYARQATVVHVAVQVGVRPRVYAVGNATGGQHLLPRWTVWDGDATRLSERDQTFETFGGLSAGGLTDLVATADGPRIVGAWSPHNRDMGIAVWSLHGAVWERDSIADLESSSVHQQLARAATATDGTPGAQLVLAGATARFDGDNPLSQPAAWFEQSDGRWVTLALDSVTSSSWGIATDVTCPNPAGDCWVVGGSRGAGDGPLVLTLWRVDPRSTTVRDTHRVDRIEFDVTDKPALVAADDHRLYVIEQHTRQLLTFDIVAGPGEGRATALPAGSVQAVAVIDRRVFAAVQEPDGRQGLWSLNLAR